MRLSAELLGTSEQRTNPLGEREIVLRGLAIPAVEHLGVTRDAFDTIDFTDNRLGRLENFPRLLRLSSLLLASNLIESMDHANISKNIPNLKYLDLSCNQISSLLEISNLGKACEKLEVLSLTGNPVTSKYSIRQELLRFILETIDPNSIGSDTDVSLLFCYVMFHPRYVTSRDMTYWRSMKRDYFILAISPLYHRFTKPCLTLFIGLSLPLVKIGRQHYRLYTIKNLPSLKVLDYLRITKSERERADRLAKSAAGAALEADLQGETSKTFIPGEGLSAEATFTTSFTTEEKEQIRQLVANASSPAEIEEIEQAVQRGVLPPQLVQNRKRPPSAENGTATATSTGAGSGTEEQDPPTKKSRVDNAAGGEQS